MGTLSVVGASATRSCHTSVLFLCFIVLMETFDVSRADPRLFPVTKGVTTPPTSGKKSCVNLRKGSVIIMDVTDGSSPFLTGAVTKWPQQSQTPGDRTSSPATSRWSTGKKTRWRWQKQQSWVPLSRVDYNRFPPLQQAGLSLTLRASSPPPSNLVEQQGLRETRRVSKTSEIRSESRTTVVTGSLLGRDVDTDTGRRCRLFWSQCWCDLTGTHTHKNW